MSREEIRSAVVRGLAARFRAFDLSGAAVARTATELARRHNGGAIPAEEVEAAAERFGVRLRAACNAMRPVSEQ